MKKLSLFSLIGILSIFFSYGQQSLNEDFSGGTLPTGWSMTSVSPSDIWYFGGSLDFGGSSVRPDASGNSGEYARIDFSNDPDTTALVTPRVSVAGMTNPRLTFSYITQTTNTGFSPYNRLIVDYWNGTKWINITVIDTLTTAGWTFYEFPILAYKFNTDSVQFRFAAQEGGAAIGGTGTVTYDQDLAIDEVVIEQTPTCFKATALMTSNLTLTSIDLGWTDPNSASSFQIEYGTAGFTPGTGTMMVTSANPASLTGLTSNTAYEWRVRPICAVADTAAWTNLASFYTGYCTPNPSSVDGQGITNVSFDTVNNTTGTETGNYGDYSNYVGNMPQGLATPVDITYSTGYTYVTEIYVDWNNDLDFDDTGENVYSGVSLSTNPTTLNASVTVPGGQALGQYRMRIGGADTGPPTPCYTGSWGSFEDYTINVVAPPACIFPSNQATNVISSDSALASWSDPNSATMWEVEWDLAGYTTGTASNSAIVTTDTFYLITGLSGQTAYDWAVRAICGPADTSSWSTQTSFTTPCAAFTAPFIESFPTTGLPNCWTQGGNSAWEYGPGFNAYGAGSVADHTSGGGGRFIGMDGSDNSGSDSSWLISPMVDVSGLTTPELRFFMFSNNTNDAALNRTRIHVWDGSAWIQVDSIQANLGPNWVEQTYDLSALSISGITAVRFTITPTTTGGSAFYNDILLDDIEFREQPTCPDPSALMVSSITSSSVSLAWTENGPATNWQIEYDTAGFTPGTGTVVNVTTNPYSLTGLNASTNYEWYVRSVCGVADSSNWIGVGSFTTACPAVNSYPYTEGFENGVPPNCWSTNILAGTSNWTSNNGNQNSSVSAYAGTSNAYYYSGNYNGDASQLITPNFDLTSLTTPQVRFWYSQVDWSGDQDTLGVYYRTSSVGSWTYLTSFSSAALSWTQVTLTLPNASSDYSLMFEAYSGYGRGVTLDEFEVRETPLCPAPSMLGETNLSSDTVTVFWTEMGTATQWEVEWDTAGYTPGMANNSMIVNVDTFYTIMGLTPNTDYDWTVRAICGPADTSVWSTSSSFKTTLQGPQPLSCTTGNPSVLFAEEFDAVGSWTGDVGTGTTAGQWNFGHSNGTGSGGTGPLSSHSGTNYVYVEASGTTGAPWGTNVVMVSPAIDLSAATNDAELSFWMHAFGQTMGTLNIGVGTSATGPFTNVFTYAGQLQPVQSDPYQNVGIDLSAYVGNTIYLEFDFLVGSNFYSDIALDLLEVSGCVSCTAPSNPIASNAGLTTADLGWTENGTATTWEVEYGPTGYTPGTGTATIVTTNPYTVTGLTASTSYDFYVRSICGPADTSGISPAGSFATLNGVPYSQDFENFSNGNIINDEGWFSTSTAAPYWSIGTSTGSSGTGPTVDHTIGTGGKFAYLETSGSYPALTPDTLIGPQVITSNGDSLLELSFWYHMHGSTMGDLQVWVTGSINGPMMLGTISGQQQVGQTDPWLQWTGLVQGYQNDTVRIVYVGLGTVFTSDMAIDDVSLDLPPAANLALTAVTAPVSGCGLTSTETVTVDITNFGSAPQTGFTLAYSLNGVAITPETYTGTINPGASVSYSFTTTANLATPGAYDIVAYTQLTGDANNANDTSSASVNSIALASLPYAESFENGPANWFLTGNGSWNLGTPAGVALVGASDGVNAWATGLSFNYSNGEEHYLNSPCFDLSGTTNPWISFDINWDIEFQWDGALMQVSTNGGSSWATLGALGDTVNWYNDTADVINALGIDPTGQSWTGTGTNGSGGWINARHELSAFAGQSSVRFRLLFASDGAVVEEGIAFDNVRVYDSIPMPPYYPIGTINTVDANGVADSLNVEVRTSGTVVGVDLDGNNGLSFTIIDMSSTSQEGINVFNFNDVSGYVVNEGDSIEVWGDIDQFNGLQEVFVDSIIILKTNALVPAPRLVTTLDESTESNHIEMRDLTVVQASGSGSYNMNLTDGTNTFTMRVDADTDVNDSLNISPLLPGDTICSVIGIGGQFDSSNPYTSGYQIFPMRFSDLDTTSCQTTGIEDVATENSQLNIFPNPTTGTVTIQAMNIKSNDARIMVRDMSGKILFEDRVNKSEFSTTLDFSDRAKGLYFITIIDGENMINEKLIKN